MLFSQQVIVMSQTPTFKQQLKSLSSQYLGPRGFILVALISVFGQASICAATARELRPQIGSEVIEVFAPRTKGQPTTQEEAAAQAKMSIQSARELQDPRYLGRARAALQRWWGKEDATQEVLVLQATIEQSLHLFDDARGTLQRIITKNPENIQAWLTIASLDRLSGNYNEALNSCRRALRVSNSGTAKIYGDVCTADIQCHLSNTALPFRALLGNMSRQRLNPEALSWGFSLLAECEERSGELSKALDAYRSSIALAADNYTAISFADALLRNKQPEKALQVLATLPKSDSVLLRLAHAMRMRELGQWKLIRSDLLQRFQESAMRGDDVKLHARERAYAALWLGDDSKQAVIQSSINIEAQKEVIDWLLLFESLEKAKDKAARKRYVSLLQTTGLRDQRIDAWIAKK
jgi:tetratricopeptide (TPR) repeat protein